MLKQTENDLKPSPMKKVLIALLIPFVGFACTPFDSNQYNKKLIQHSWQQVEISYPDKLGDSLITEQSKGVTILTFTPDSCFEKLQDLKTSIHYSYDIKDYILKLERDSNNINYLNIQKLTTDSLILYSNYRFWRYIKKAD